MLNSLKGEVVYYGPVDEVVAQTGCRRPVTKEKFLVYVVGIGRNPQASKSKREAQTLARYYGAVHYCRVVGLS